MSSDLKRSENLWKKRPANACSRCSEMKVRCDLEKPSCSRCEKRRKPCKYPERKGKWTEPMAEALEVFGEGLAPRRSTAQTRLETTMTGNEGDLRQIEAARSAEDQTKRSDLCYLSDPPAKRSKSNDGTWQCSEQLPSDALTTSTVRAILAQDCIVTNGDRDPQNNSSSRHNNESYAPTYRKLVLDALAANPQGLSSWSVFEWVRCNRTQISHIFGEVQLLKAIQRTLSEQSRKRKPTVRKAKAYSSEKLAYIWRLAHAIPSGPLVEDTPTEEEPQLASMPDHTVTESKDYLKDVQASNPRSAARRSHACQARSGTSAAAQPREISVHNDIQALGIEHAAASNVDSRHVVSCMTWNTQILPSGPTFAYLEPEMRTKCTSLRLGRVSRNTSGGTVAKTTIVNLDPTKSDAPTVRANAHGSEELEHLDLGIQQQIADLAIELYKIKTRRDRLEREISTHAHTRPNKKGLRCEAEQAKETGATSINVLDKAYDAAPITNSELQINIDRVRTIETAEQELERVAESHTILRQKLSELVD